MDTTESLIAQLLLSKGVLDRSQHRLVGDRRNQQGGCFHLLVMEMGLAPEDTVIDIVAQATGLQRISLTKMQPERRAIEKLPTDFCQRHCVFPYAVRGGGKSLWLVMADPTDMQVRNEALAISGLVSIRPFVAPPSEIQTLIKQCMPQSAVQEDTGASIPLSATLDELDEIRAVFDAVQPPDAESDHPAATDLAAVLGAPRSEPVYAPGQTGDATAEMIARLSSGQQKTSRHLRSLIQACVTKGLFTNEELQNRLREINHEENKP
jgi:hypothetical protein